MSNVRPFTDVLACGSRWKPARSAGQNSFRVAVDDGCTACGACLITCPERALLAAPKRPATVDQLCSGCLACIEICPRDAITVEIAP